MNKSPLRISIPKLQGHQNSRYSAYDKENSELTERRPRTINNDSTPNLKIRNDSYYANTSSKINYIDTVSEIIYSSKVDSSLEDCHSTPESILRKIESD